MRTEKRRVRGARRWPAMALAIVAAGGLGLPASTAVAQASFTWPDTTVDVAKYTTVEECLVAIERVAQGYERQAREKIWRDTMPWDPTELRREPPAPVTETARRCSARFKVAAVPLQDFSPMLELFLDAARDEDVATLVNRRLAALKPDALLERAWVIDTVVRSYTRARPVRLAPALELARKLGRPTRADLAERALQVYGTVAHASVGVQDTALTRSLAGEMLAMVDSMPVRERRKLEDKLGPAFGWGIYMLMEMKADPKVFLDSLRVSTAAFVAQKRALWAKATGERREGMSSPIGQRAPTLEGDFWFPRAGADERRPRPGRVSLVVFDQAEIECRPNCAGQYATLRRLADRFPDLDVTIVTRTRGYFWYAHPASPAEEAALIQQNLAAYRVPGTLAVSRSEFWRLPDPDRRAIMRDLVNVTNYTFGKSLNVTKEFTAFLVDQDGVIVHAAVLGRGVPEESFAELIGVLLDRQRARS